MNSKIGNYVIFSVTKIANCYFIKKKERDNEKNRKKKKHKTFGVRARLGGKLTIIYLHILNYMLSCGLQIGFKLEVIHVLHNLPLNITFYPSQDGGLTLSLKLNQIQLLPKPVLRLQE